MKEEETAQVTIFNLSGRVPFSASIQASNDFEISNLSARVCVVHLKTQIGKLGKKAIIK